MSQGYFPGFSWRAATQRSPRRRECAASSDLPAWRSVRASACPRSISAAAPARSRPRNRVPTEHSRVRHRRHDRSRPDNPDARDGLNPLARLARAMLHLIRFSIAPMILSNASSCAASTITLARASIGNRVSCSSVTIARNSSTPALPCAATNPSSARCARKALMIWVRWRIRHRACDAASTDPAVRPIRSAPSA